MPRDPEDGKGLIAAWHTNHRVTVYLLENLSPELWSQSVPGSPRRTVRMIAAHIHNARCMWIKMLAARHRIPVPRTLDGRVVRPPELLRALSRSSEGITCLIRLGVARGGAVPRAAWQNFPTDLPIFSATSWRTRLTIVGSWSCWRGNWGTVSLRASPQDSGSGPGERANDFVECVLYHCTITANTFCLGESARCVQFYIDLLRRALRDRGRS